MKISSRSLLSTVHIQRCPISRYLLFEIFSESELTQDPFCVPPTHSSCALLAQILCIICTYFVWYVHKLQLLCTFLQILIASIFYYFSIFLF